MRRQFIYRLLAASLLLAFSPVGAPAHEGHDHDAPAATVTVPAAPRGESASDLFEVVAVAGNGELTIYVDRFATNEPVPNATVAVETPHGSIEARRAADGTYRLPAPWS